MNRRDRLSTFINLQTDYGFKKLFGSPENKGVLIKFLNALLQPQLTVRDVVYHDKEMLPADEDGKRILYDIYCTADVSANEGLYHDTDPEAEHHFVLEMQNVYEVPFEDRVLYYSARAVAAQGERGWDYSLSPVISVVVTDFDLPHLQKSLVHDMVMAERTTHEVLTEKLRILFLSLKQMKHTDFDDCTNPLEELLYIIKNSDKMDKNSKAYTCGKYQDLFDAAETAPMASEDVVRYSQSLHHMRATQRGIDAAQRAAMARGLEQGVAQGMAQGMAQGIEQGLQQGRTEEQLQIARNMLALGLPEQTVQLATNLPLDRIRSLHSRN